MCMNAELFSGIPKSFLFHGGCFLLMWFHPCTGKGESPSMKTFADIPYDETAGGDAGRDSRCRLDITVPEGAKDYPVLVWFHAGGLKNGTRYTPGEHRGRGYGIVAVGTRLVPGVKAESCLEDAAAATAWVFRHISEYGGSPEKVVVAGASAGGYLSLMLGLDKRWLAKHGIDANRLLGIGALSGQAITHVAMREERGIPATRPVIDDLAPLYHVRKDAAPILLVTGDRELELLGRWEENAFLARMLKLNGHPDVTFYELEGFDHAGLEKPAHAHLITFMQRLVTGHGMGAAGK